MLGAIAGDIIGSVYEAHNTKRMDFPLFHYACRFTDDTVLTVATADALLSGGGYTEHYREYARLYPNAGYGPKFIRWARSDDPEPYFSYGNGSAMRVSPVAWAMSTLDEVLTEAERSASVTHNHPEGIKGAQTTAAAIFLARNGSSRDEIRGYVREHFGYVLKYTVEEMRPHYRFDMSCQGTVPVALQAALESEDWEDAVRRGISLGGDSDTIGCITGAIAQALYGGLPEHVSEKVFEFLDEYLTGVVVAFCDAYGAY